MPVVNGGNVRWGTPRVRQFCTKSEQLEASLALSALSLVVHSARHRTYDFRNVLVEAELAQVSALDSVEEVEAQRNGRLRVAHEVVDDAIAARPRPVGPDEAQDLLVHRFERRDRLDLLVGDARVLDDGGAHGAIRVANEDHS